MTVEINIRTQLGRDRTRGVRPLLRRIGGRTLKTLQANRRVLSILVTDDAEMRELNRRWRSLDRTTDVLSFEGEGQILGDVVISLDQAERQAERLGVAWEEELARLLIHGTLHLAGHDHRTSAERRKMNALTEDLLSRAL